MKRRADHAQLQPRFVAPITGAWIETNGSRRREATSLSRLLRARGLKRAVRAGRGGCQSSRLLRARGLKLFRWRRRSLSDRCSVAPITGAWIETFLGFFRIKSFPVAPITGAWIETRCLRSQTDARWVAPITGAWIETTTPPPRMEWMCPVAPITGAWIETPRASLPTAWRALSRLLRARGLKLVYLPCWIDTLRRSRLLRARGLKRRA